jgi:hypothetical protein
MAANTNDLPIENIVIKQGATYEEDWLLEDEETGQPIDLSAWTFTGQIRRAYDGELLATFTFVVKNQTTNTGEVGPRISAANTLLIPVLGSDQCEDPENWYPYDIFGNDGSRTLLMKQGKAQVIAGVTHA